MYYAQTSGASINSLRVDPYDGTWTYGDHEYQRQAAEKEPAADF